MNNKRKKKGDRTDEENIQKTTSSIINSFKEMVDQN
jgi:hypothetical protein